MPKAQKTESGMWRCRAFYQDADGRHQKSFTAPTKKEAEFLAAQFSNSANKPKKPYNMTLKEAFEAYIETKRGVLSPSTIPSYKKIPRLYLQDIINKKLCDLTQSDIQNAISKEALAHSPKTVSCINGLLRPVLSAYYPDFHYTVKLPQAKKPDIYVPTEEQIKKLRKYFENTDMEIPILLAVCLGLRKSEIVGLKWENVSEDCRTIKIDKAIVSGEGNKPFEKAPKSVAGYRTLPVPNELAEKLQNAQRTSEHVTQLNANVIYKRFSNALEVLGIPHFKFHALRHYNASVMLALNVPNKYAQARMGHATDNMLKNVYQHLMSEKEKEVNDSVNKYFDDFFE